jgi:hypothetical protein
MRRSCCGGLGPELLAAVLALMCCGAWGQQAPPSIMQRGVVNAASHVPPSLPTGSLAPGSRIHVYGVRLGPEQAARAAASALPQTLAGVRVRLAQGSTTLTAPLISVGAEQIEAILPAATPLGPVDLTVEYAGQSSLPVPIQVAPWSFGIAEVIREGEVVTIRGTGLGTAPALSHIEVFVGSRQVGQLRFAGPAACCAGLDEIIFDLPPDSIRACNVPVQVLLDGRIASNVKTLAIAAPGRPCEESDEWIVQAASGGGRKGFALLLRATFRADFDPHTTVNFAFDAAAVQFSGPPARGAATFPALPPLGTCKVTMGVFEVGGLVYVSAADAPPLPGPFRSLTLPFFPGLDAGEFFALEGPKGARRIGRDSRRPNTYTALLGGNPPLPTVRESPLYLDPGVYEISGTGGQDVGRFHASVRVDRPVRWTNRARTNVVDRARGVTLRWKAHPDQIVAVMAMNAEEGTGAGAFCLCLAPAAAGRFTIPPRILANVPGTAGFQQAPVSFLAIAALPGRAPVPFHTEGLDAGFPLFVSLVGRTVVYR